jgi:iron complex outermembrane receptor protein
MKTRFKRCGWFLANQFLSILLLATTAVCAESTADTNSIQSLKRMSLDELMNVEIPTVYAASRHEQTVAQAPAAVTVITRDDIRKYGYRTLAQALASVPGFYISDDRAYQYLGVRGLLLPTDYNVRVLFLLNGLPVNDKYYGAFTMELTPDLLDAIDRIEVVKGPASALFGSEALFATINLITRSGAAVNGAIVSAEVGSDPSGRGVFTYGNLLTNGVDLFLSGHYEYDTGERSLSFGKFGSAHNADDQWLADAFLSAKYQDFFLQLWYADRQKVIPTGQYGTIVGDDRTKERDAAYLTELRWQHTLSDDKTLMLRAYYEEHPYNGVFAYDDPVLALDTEQTTDRWLAYEAQFNWQPIQRHQLTLGSVFEYHWTWLSGHYTDPAGNVTAVYPGAVNNFSYWAVYLQDEFRVLPQLTLTVGGRYDAYPDFHVERTTPRASLIWNATKQTTLKLLYGQAFRAPSEYERTYPGGSGSGVDNLSLKSEQITTYELVLDQDFRHGLNSQLSFFHNDAQDLIGTTVDNESNTVFRNLSSVRTWGVEAELTKKFANAVRGFVNGTWQQSRENSSTLVNSPEWIGNLGVIVPVIGDKLDVALRENYVSSRATRVAGEQTQDELVTDLTISSENALPNWSFLLSVQNLFDDRYSVPSGADGTLDTIPQRGRTVYFRATYKF